MRLFPQLATIIFIFLAQPVWAQGGPLIPVNPVAGAGAMAAGEVLDQPICFMVHNQAPYSVLGTVLTDEYVTPEGIVAHHRSNFRLKSQEGKEFCSYGPFYEGRKLGLTLRTLVPIFSCKTALIGPVIIRGRHKPEGGTETWAICH